jgi:hypothetical protein
MLLFPLFAHVLFVHVFAIPSADGGIRIEWVMPGNETRQRRVLTIPARRI